MRYSTLKDFEYLDCTARPYKSNYVQKLLKVLNKTKTDNEDISYADVAKALGTENAFIYFDYFNKAHDENIILFCAWCIRYIKDYLPSVFYKATAQVLEDYEKGRISSIEYTYRISELPEVQSSQYRSRYSRLSVCMQAYKVLLIDAFSNIMRVKIKNNIISGSVYKCYMSDLIAEIENYAKFISDDQEYINRVVSYLKLKKPTVENTDFIPFDSFLWSALSRVCEDRFVYKICPELIAEDSTYSYLVSAFKD